MIMDATMQLSVTLNSAEALAQLESSEQGLSNEIVKQRQASYGKNELVAKPYHSVILEAISHSARIRMDDQEFWVYILLCDNNTYYTGYTNNLMKRYQSHIDGTGKCKYTRSFKPIAIAQSWKIKGDKILAMQLERSIKKLSRQNKEKIIANPSTFSVHASPDMKRFFNFNKNSTF